MKAEQLKIEFASRGVPHPDGLLLLAPADALALVDRAAEEGVPICRVHEFRVTNWPTASPSEHLADFSGAVARGHGCWEDAESFIRGRGGHGLVFELSLGDDPVEAV